MITREENTIIVDLDERLKKLLAISYRLKDPSQRPDFYGSENNRRITDFKSYINCISFYNDIQEILSDVLWDKLPNNESQLCKLIEAAVADINITIKNIDAFAEKQGYIEDYLREG